MAERADAGDLSAAELFREHGAFVARFLFRLGVPADAIQDTVQEVFLVVHQRGGYRRGPAKPTSYLAMIASNAASAQRRKARTRASRLGESEPDELSARGADPLHTLETQDALWRLQAALDKLEPDLRATLLLADGEDETCASIAEAMGVPVGTVYWRLHQARKRFQRALFAVDASSKGPRAARLPDNDRTATASSVFMRSTKMLITFLGFALPSWRGSQAHALLRETAKQMPIEFDVQAELVRYTEAAARLPVPTPSTVHVVQQASSGTFGSMTGAMKIGLIVTAGGAALIAALQRPPSHHAALSPPLAGERSVAVPENPSSAAREPADAPFFARAPDSALRPETSSTASSTGPHAHAPARRTDTLSRKVSPRAMERSVNTGTFTGTTSSGKPAAAAIRRTLKNNADTRPLQAPPQGAKDEPAANAPVQPTAQQSTSSVGIVEAQALGRAESLLQKDPAQALAIVRKVALQSQADYLAEEREYIEVMALYGLSQRVDAKRAADAFLSTYPHSVFRARVIRVRNER